MAYISSKQAKCTTNTTASNTSWVDVTGCETATTNMVPGTNNKAVVKAGWHVTASVLAGDVRLVIHNGSTDIELGLWSASVGTNDRSVCEVHIPAVSPEALHKARLQIRAGSALSTTTINANDAWIDLSYLTT